MDVEKMQAELTAELIKAFHDNILERYGIPDDKIMRILERSHPQTGVPKVGQDVLIRYKTKAGADRWAVSRWTGEHWSGGHEPLAWYFLPVITEE